MTGAFDRPDRVVPTRQYGTESRLGWVVGIANLPSQTTLQNYGRSTSGDKLASNGILRCLAQIQHPGNHDLRSCMVAEASAGPDCTKSLPDVYIDAAYEFVHDRRHHPEIRLRFESDRANLRKTMTRIPNSPISLLRAARCLPHRWRREPWLTPEGILGQARLQRSRSRRHRFPRDLARHRALSARPLPHDVCQPALDHPAICRVLHGGRFQRVLSPQSRRRPEGPVGRVRSRHPSRL